MQTILHLIDATAVMSMLALLYGIVRRLPWRPVHRKVLLGVAFGLGAVTTMLQPILVVGDLIIDCRALFIGFAGAFLGMPGAAAAVLMAGAGRLSIGFSSTALYGIGSLFVAAAAGLLWRRLSPGIKPLLGRFVVLGLMISTSYVVLLFVPGTHHALASQSHVLFLTAYNVAGSVALGSFMEREHAQERREDVALQEARTDPLTGLLNRRGFQHRFALSERDKFSQGSAILLIDIDHFKQINDHYGHAAGDEILQLTARRICDCLRPMDSVLRFGGEEFGVLLADLSEAEAFTAAERLRKQLATPCPLADGTVVAITVSLGGWSWVTGRSSVDAAFAAADQALYAAKSAGRDRTVFAPRGMVLTATADRTGMPTTPHPTLT